MSLNDVVNMRVLSGHITISRHLLEQSKAAEDAYQDLMTIGLNYESATPEQRARFDAWQDRMAASAEDREYDDEYDE